MNLLKISLFTFLLCPVILSQNIFHKEVSLNNSRSTWTIPNAPLNKSMSIWTELNPNLPRCDYKGVFFRGDTGWVTGEYGTILKTTNGGDIWLQKTTGTASFVTSVSTFNGRDILASSKDGLILSSNDAGDSWDTLTYDATVDFWKVKFTADKEAWLCGTKATLLHTTDAGITWSNVSVPAPSNQDLWSLDFFNNKFGFITCNNGELYKTTDAGVNWFNSATGDEGEIYSVNVIDSAQVLCGGESGKIYYSSNYGISWDIALNEMPTTITDIVCANDTVVYAVGDEHELYYKSFNGGHSFVPMQHEYISRFGIFFSNELTGYTVGANLHIFKTVDGGEHWFSQVFNDDILCSYPVTRDKICILTNHFSQSSARSALYISPDAALSWRRIEVFPYCSLHDNFSDIVFFNEDIGLLTSARDGQIFRSSNGGNIWSYINDDMAAGYGGKLYKYDPSTVYAIFANKVFKTTDMGETWATFTEMANASMSSLYYSGLSTMWLAASDLYKSTNAGASWEKVSSTGDHYFQDVYFIDEFTGMASTNNKIYRTTDGGSTWTSFNSNFGPRFYSSGIRLFMLGGNIVGESTNSGETWFTNSSLSGKEVKTLSMINGQFATAYGLTGLVIKENNQVTSTHSDIHKPLGYQLFQNYPNPFNPATTIRYSVAENSFVSIKVFNILGKELLSLINEVKPAGLYDVDFDAKNFASGVYIYRITAGNYSNSKRMLLIK